MHKIEFSATCFIVNFVTGKLLTRFAGRSIVMAVKRNNNVPVTIVSKKFDCILVIINRTYQKKKGSNSAKCFGHLPHF